MFRPRISVRIRETIGDSVRTGWSRALAPRRLDADGPTQQQQEMERQLRQHRNQVMQLIEKCDNFECIHVDYEDLLNDTENQVNRLVDFIGEDKLDAAAMPGVIKRELHREN